MNNSDSDFLGKGWAFPVTTNAGEVLFSCAEANIKQSLILILGTAPGERVMLPEFGCRINELLFAANNSTTEGLAELYVRQAVERWEPRVVVSGVNSVIEFTDRNVLTITLSYVIRDKNQPDNLVYPFFLK